MSDRASGYCYVNDCNLAVFRTLLSLYHQYHHSPDINQARKAHRHTTHTSINYENYKYSLSHLLGTIVQLGAIVQVNDL